MQKYTIKNFDRDFPNDDACLEYLKNLRWPDGITCSKCQRVTKHHKITGRAAYACDFCGNHVYPMAGTILEHSSTPLRLWFHAMFLMGATRCGISAKQLERELGVTYKTAWRIFSQVRSMLGDDVMSLLGQIEVDETYIGGKRKGKRGRGASGKTIAVGMVQREGKAVVKIIPSVKGKDLIPILEEHIPLNDATTIYTDELASYNKLDRMGFSHETVQHSAKQYVNGTAHTNNVEGLWSIIKGGILGVNKHVSPQHLQGYLDAYVFRYNHREDETPMFLQILDRLALRAE
jgi:transposase-like protein